MREAVIISACRTAVGKAKRGALVQTRPDDMAATAIKEAIHRAGVDPNIVEDLQLGCAFPEAEQGMNVARIAVHRAGLPESMSAATVNRFCSSGLQAVWNATMDINQGAFDCSVAAGAESMSMVPMGGNKIVPNPWLAENYPQAYISMGQTAENVAIKYNVTREAQDEWALRSNDRALAANESGAFKEQIVPMNAVRYDGNGGREEFVFDVDEGPRKSTLESLASLKPAFVNPRADIPGAGTVTAGNSSQMSDGAAALLLIEAKKARELGLKPMAALRAFTVAGLDPAYMGLGPAFAIPRLIERFGPALGVKLDDVDVFEINEAFASQAVYCVRELGIDPEKVNPNGGAIALGHPLGCTGAKLSTQVVYWLRDNKKKWGIVSMCIGGGMGAAGLFENLNA
ncbi:MAG: thiolase family protein [Deltaproteobacteria bacterium]|nr:thiolase family protein [Deltaproteobacteria bacterium]